MRMGLLILALGPIAALSGCAALTPNCPTCNSHADRSSSLVSFLYPNGAAPKSDSMPELPVPLRVGLAFLPAQSGSTTAGLSEAQKEQLLERIRRHFADRTFVSEIVIIPDYYLSGAKGFAGLEGIQRLYNVDLMALVSYDQVTYSGDRKYGSLAYLTIVGAFVVQGSEHDVTTLVDLAVVAPKTRSLVLRAGGTDTSHGTSTLIDRAKEERATDAAGYSKATDAMIAHFDTALTKFESDVKAGTAQVRLANRDGTPRSGGGALDGAGLLLLAVLLATRRTRLRYARSRTTPTA
jgi:rhombotail lipoprotein